YFDTAYSQWNIRGQKIACYIGSLETIASCETGHRRERAKELLDRYKESSYFDRSNTGPAEAYIPYEESYVQGFDRPSRGTRPDRKLARNWDKERSHKCKSVEPSVHVHHPTFIGGGTVSGIINSETFTSGSSNKDQKRYRIQWTRSAPSSQILLADTDESTSASDTDASKDNINEKDSPKIDKTAFCKAHYAIPNSSKLQLNTGRIVEDILFEFAKDMDYEHHAHSYIVDFDDEDVRVLFTDTEWNELTKDRIGVPSVPRDIAEELAKYGSKTLKELRTKVMKSYLKDEEEYDVQKHYNQEWIQMTMRTLYWFTVALFGTCIDFCVRDAQLGTDIKRFYPSRNLNLTDAPSLSSANRKNRRRKANARKLIGRKVDRIIYITNRLVEIGAIEGARAFAGAMNYDDQKADKLQVFGILHLGLYIQFARLWRAGGSICIFRKDPQSFYVDSKFSKNGLISFIKCLKKIYQYKNNLQILNILNDTESGYLLEGLLKDDNEQCSTPPLVTIRFFCRLRKHSEEKKEKK
ncbi:11341_t:CDS:10, partial [Gigaspora rosea]